MKLHGLATEREEFKKWMRVTTQTQYKYQHNRDEVNFMKLIKELDHIEKEGIKVWITQK